MKQNVWHCQAKKIALLFFMWVCSYGYVLAKTKTCVLNVGSFNISSNNWDCRKNNVASLVRFYEFDVFGTQEGTDSQLKDVAGDEYDYIYADGFWRRKEHIAKGKSQHNGLFWLKDKFSLLDSGRFWLSETPDIDSFGWDAAEKRGCIWAKLKEKSTGKNFFFFCVHLDHIGNEARLQSAKLILNRIREIAGEEPAFCVGDFNGSPNSKHIQAFQADGMLINSRSISQMPPYGTLSTFVGYGKEPIWDGDMIDYIWVTKKVAVKKYGVLNDMPYGKRLSDHFPVMIKAEIK